MITTNSITTAGPFGAVPLPVAPQPASGPTANQQQRHLEELIANAMTMRRELFGRLADPRRNIEHECGHPDLDAEIPVEYYQRLYARDPIAARVVSLMPEECWQVSPSVYEEEDAETTTPFEEAIDALGKQLAGEQSWQAGEEGSAVWNVLEEVDTVSGIGRYSVLLLGLDDGLPLSSPAAGFAEVNSAGAGKDDTSQGAYAPYSFTLNAEATKGRRLLFVRALSECQATVSRVERNHTSPRFGKPTEYTVTLGDGFGAASHKVHWSRVVHVAEGDTFATPRLQDVYETVLDLRKVRGGSAEMYWRGAFPGYSFETHPGSGGDVLVDTTSVKDEFEKFQNGLQRAMNLIGMTMKSHAPQVVDPNPQLQAQIEAICIAKGWPIRIFKGSERGELASSQDEKAHRKRVKKRRERYLSPRVIAAFVNRLIALGVLPQPKEYTIWWPDQEDQTQTEKAAVALTVTQSLAAYVSGGVEAIVPPLEYLTIIHGWTDEEAQATLENAAGVAEERAAEEEERRAIEAEEAERLAAIAGANGNQGGGNGVQQKRPVPAAPAAARQA